VKNITTLGERSAAGLSDESGVLVIEILPFCPAEGKLLADDVILQVNNEAIKNINDLKNVLMKNDKTLNITFSRNQRKETVAIEIK